MKLTKRQVLTEFISRPSAALSSLNYPEANTLKKKLALVAPDSYESLVSTLTLKEVEYFLKQEGLKKREDNLFKVFNVICLFITVLFAIYKC